MSFDLSTTQLSGDARTLVVKHPGSGETVAEIDLLAMDDAKPRAVRRAQERKRTKSRNPLAIDLDQIREEALDLLVACTVNWRGIEWQGAPLDCTGANAKMLYEALPWLRAEVDRFVNELGNFLVTSGENSANSSGTTSA